MMNILRANAKILDIFNIIREYGPISKSGVIENVNLSRPTATNVIETLKKENFIREIGLDESKGGRRSILLKVVPDRAYSMGIDIGLDGITIVIMDIETNVVAKVTIPNKLNKEKSRVLEDRAVIVERIIKAADKAIRKARILPEKIIGIGIGDVGMVDKANGISISSAHYIPGWQDVPLKNILQRKFDIPVFLERDTNLMALAERWYGAGENVDNLLCISLRIGIGLGILINGQICGGVSGNAGEWGHSIVDKNGPKCICGKYGCLETLVGSPAIVDRARNLLKGEGKSLIRDLINNDFDNLTPEIVFEAARNGDNLAIEVVNGIAEILGLEIANLINLFNPAIIILGGRFIKAKKVLLETLTRVIKMYSTSFLFNQVKIKLGKLGNDSVALGAASFAQHEIFNSHSAI